MKVTIFGNMNSSNAFEEYVTEKLNNDVEKYFDSALEANVYFKKESHKAMKSFHVTIVINEGSKTGITIKADADSDDPHYSFDMALNKIARQLRKYKKKIRDYARQTHDQKPEEVIEGQKYVLPYEFEEDIEESEGKAKDNKKLDIIAEKETRVETLTVREAIMKMDLANLPALMFVNKDNGRINVVYHRKDGNISWVDPKKK